MIRLAPRPALMFGVQLLGNAAVLGLGYYWLGIGESRTSTLLLSFLVALFTASLFCWMHGAGFVWSTSPRIKAAFGVSLRHLAPLMAAALLILLLYAALSAWSAYSGRPAFTIASFLTHKLSRPIKPGAVLRVFNVTLWLLRWVVAPVLILPVVSAVAARGWRGFAAVRSRPGWRDWLLVPLLLLAALWLPFVLLAWKPMMNAFGVELFSLIIRGALAYLLFAGGLLALESAVPVSRAVSFEKISDA